jgi:Protein of unknown function (DUF1570)
VPYSKSSPRFAIPMERFRHGTMKQRLGFLIGVCVFLAGCQSLQLKPVVEPPSKIEMEREQLIIHSDFRLPRKHRLFEDLEKRRDDLGSDLLLPASDEPIHIYLFADQDEFRKYAKRIAGEFQDRRAFFVKSDTELKVYGYWGDRIAEDMRHEVTHAYLHGVVSNIPLWLDEGLAEFYEVERSKNGLNSNHIFLLASEFRKGKWQPNLDRLEMFREPSDFNQLEYAESWLWVHFLMHESSETRKVVQDSLARLRMSGETQSIASTIEAQFPDVQIQVVEHLKRLADGY